MDPKKIAARVKALLAKTTENGCTEEEAFAAMEKAREMMDKYGISLDAVETEAETIAQGSADRRGWQNFYIKDRIAVRVAQYCDVKIWIDNKSQNPTYAVFGTETDRMFFNWLLDSLQNFIVIQCKSSRMRSWSDQKAFMVGAAERINHRLAVLINERRKSATMGDGRSLAVVKMQLVERAFSQLGIFLQSGTTKTTYKAGAAFAAGQAAGDRASFNRPVGGNAGGATRMIGGR